MENVFIVHECDAWHSHSSKAIFGIFTSKQKAIANIQDYCKLSPNDIESLNTVNQTQGREENFTIEEMETDTIVI